MRIICYYNKNLKMSSGKMAAQIGHVCKELGKMDYLSFFQKTNENDTIVVLGLRQNKFKEKMHEILQIPNVFSYVQKDLGYTEVELGETTAFGYIEQEV